MAVSRSVMLAPGVYTYISARATPGQPLGDDGAG